MHASFRDQLIASHIEVARRIALKIARRCPAWISRDDLIGAAMLGLIEAAERYDGSRGDPFLAFAELRIRGAIQDELRRGDIMPRQVRKLARRLATAMRDLERDGPAASDQAIADAMGVIVERYRTRLAQLAHVKVGPLDATTANLVADDAAPDVVADHRRDLVRVGVALERLARRDIDILQRHFVEELTYQDIAGLLRITPSRVCQLLWRVVDRLRAELELAHEVAA